MNDVELALEKQRLQLQSAAQRVTLAQHAEGLQPLGETADRIRTGAQWARRHPEALAGGLVIAAAVRPGVRRFLWRWGRRSFFAWRLWRQTVGEARATRQQ